MLKKIFKIFKKIILASFILYGFNLIMSPLSVIIPLNFITVSTVTVLGFPGLLGLVLIKLIAL